MANPNKVINVVFAGLGGQGILKASDILADAAFLAGRDVKKSELHGMSQRGGSVSSDVRFAATTQDQVFSPMAPIGEADFLVILDMTQIEPNRRVLRENGIILTPETLLEPGQDMDDADRDDSTPLTRRNLNVALCGLLSAYLDVPETCWKESLCRNLPAKVIAQNEVVFAFGRAKAVK